MGGDKNWLLRNLFDKFDDILKFDKKDVVIKFWKVRIYVLIYIKVVYEVK